MFPIFLIFHSLPIPSKSCQFDYSMELPIPSIPINFTSSIPETSKLISSCGLKIKKNILLSTDIYVVYIKMGFHNLNPIASTSLQVLVVVVPNVRTRAINNALTLLELITNIRGKLKTLYVYESASNPK